jgi:hypothetical protein
MSKNFAQRLLAVLAIAVIGFAVLAACSGGGDDDGGDDTDTPVATDDTSGDDDGSDGDDDQGSGDVSACDLVSKDEAAAILGEAVDDAATGAAACVYSASSLDSFASVGVSLLEMPSSDAADTAFDAGKDTIDSPEDLSGYGDEAYYDPAGGNVNVRKGAFLLTTSVSFSDGQYTTPDAKQAALDLAETSLERVP